MLNNASAWYELIKLGNVAKLRKDIDIFWRGNIVKVISTEGWLNYLNKPHTKQELAEFFNYTDLKFLSLLLKALINDGTLKKVEGEKLLLQNPVNTEWVLPEVFDEQMKDLWWDFANFIPKRLNGEYFEFSGGFNLFNWDNILSNRMYTQIRKAAFSYVKNFKNNSEFLDIGSGNGYGTTSIWSTFQEKDKTKNIKITGLEMDENLLEIAKSEFEMMAKKIGGRSIEEIQKSKDLYPDFVKGNVVSIPFQDETYDYVYASQVLHWTNAKKAISEMIRIAKPGGIIFGTQNFLPDANEFNDIHFKVIKGAEGFFSKHDMEIWAKEAGAKKIKFSTPISIFKIIK